MTGLPGILMLSSQVDRDDPLTIYGPPKIREFIEAMRRTLDMYINYDIVVKEVEGGTTILQAEDYAIRTHPLSHTKQCIAYSLEENVRPGIFFPDKAAGWACPGGRCGPSFRPARPCALPTARR